MMLNIFAFLLLFVAGVVDGQEKTIIVEGEKRTALIYPNSASAAKAGAPVLFVFHGHGGTAQSAARNFKFHALWKEAVVVYLQGLTGVPGITDPEGRRSGWQKNPGEFGDRDVKFFDAALAQVQNGLAIDTARVYVMGHSNGARFVNVLWTMRSDKITALCSSSAQGGRLLQGVKPKPIFMIAGEQDSVAPFQGQLRAIEYARQKLFKTDPSTAKREGYARMEKGSDGTEIVTYIHPGGHQFPQDAAPLIVSFFQRQSKKT